MIKTKPKEIVNSEKKKKPEDSRTSREMYRNLLGFSIKVLKLIRNEGNYVIWFWNFHPIAKRHDNIERDIFDVKEMLENV